MLIVQHDGNGWPEPGTDETANPILRLRVRVHLLGGRLEVDDARGGARRITIHLPLPGAATDPAPR